MKAVVSGILGENGVSKWKNVNIPDYIFSCYTIIQMIVKPYTNPAADLQNKEKHCKSSC